KNPNNPAANNNSEPGWGIVGDWFKTKPLLNTKSLLAPSKTVGTVVIAVGAIPSNFTLAKRMLSPIRVSNNIPVFTVNADSATE
ncbi:hypothetical protein, partial [Chromatium okenii]|uniref:hypothetical protein n=1 Tax=Chromatium okenii TaxID=61644 RepID=UPI0026EF8383